MCVCARVHVCTWEASKLSPVKVPWWSIPLSKFGYLGFPPNHLSILRYLVGIRTWHPGAEKTSLDDLHANHVIDQGVPPFSVYAKPSLLPDYFRFAVAVLNICGRIWENPP